MKKTPIMIAGLTLCAIVSVASHFAALKSEPSGQQPVRIPAKLLASRRQFDRLGAMCPMAPRVAIQDENFDGTRGRWFRPAGAAGYQKVVLYLHGGGYAEGSFLSHGSLASQFADRLKLPVLLVEYSLALEHPYPKALGEIEAVCRRLRQQHPAIAIIFLGDSSGGGLALASVSRFKQRGLPEPVQLVLISPWVDLTCQNRSYTTKAKVDPILTKAALRQYAKWYAGGLAPATLNPINGDLSSCPPTLIMVGTREILLDDSKALYAKLRAGKRSAIMSQYPGQPHVWLLPRVGAPAAQQALNEIARFVK